LKETLDFLKDCFKGGKDNILFFSGLSLLLLWMSIEYGARYINTQVAGQVITGGLILLLLRSKDKILSRYPLLAMSLFWIIVLSLSLTFSVAKLATFEELMRNIMYISLPMLVYTWCDSNNRIKLLSYLILSVGSIISSIAIITFLIDYYHTMSFNPATSPLGRTNDLGAYMLFVFPLSFSNFLYEEKHLEKASYAFVSLISFITIILTFSRGIWLSTLIALVLILSLGFRILKKNIIYLVALSIAGITPVIIKHEMIINRIMSLQNIFNNAENSLEWRKSLLRGSFEIFLDNPSIGTGLNTFPFVYSLYQERAGYFSINPHNYYLQLLAETGVTGFFTFIVLALSILYMSFKAFKHSESIFKGIALGLLVGIISSLLHISVDIDWSVSAIPILFWLEVGILISIYRAVNFKETRFSTINDRFSYIKRPLLKLLGLSLIVLPLMNYYSLISFGKAISYFNQKEYDLSEKYINWAINLAPFSSGKHYNQYAEIMFIKGDKEKALEYSEKAINSDRYNYNYYKTYSDILMKIDPIKNQNEALEALTKAVTYNPYMHPKGYQNVADFYYKYKKNNTESIKWYRDGIKSFPIAQISSYESYTPNDRYELYYIYKNLSELLQAKSTKESKEFKRISEYLLYAGDKNSSQMPASVIRKYWHEFSKSKPDFDEVKNTISSFDDIPNPPSGLEYQFIDFTNIQHKIYNVIIEYEILIKSKDKEKTIKLVDTLIKQDDNWIIKTREMK
jgi:O-antigen ligase